MAFSKLRRQQFRRFFQPSRIVLGILNLKAQSNPNIITLCFDMYCSYKPPMMAFSVRRGALSYDLLADAKECVLAVPGEKLVRETLFCGLRSGRDIDKVRECNLPLIKSEFVHTPGIASAIANIEMRILGKPVTGDHVTVFGEVLKFGVNEKNTEKCLLSVGPDTTGYRVLSRHGIHRIAVVEAHHKPSV